MRHIVLPDLFFELPFEEHRSSAPYIFFNNFNP